jgi:hypothetical protein
LNSRNEENQLAEKKKSKKNGQTKKNQDPVGSPSPFNPYNFRMTDEDRERIAKAGKAFNDALAQAGEDVKATIAEVVKDLQPQMDAAIAELREAMAKAKAPEIPPPGTTMLEKRLHWFYKWCDAQAAAKPNVSPAEFFRRYLEAVLGTAYPMPTDFVLPAIMHAYFEDMTGFLVKPGDVVFPQGEPVVISKVRVRGQTIDWLVRDGKITFDGESPFEAPGKVYRPKGAS